MSLGKLITNLQTTFITEDEKEKTIDTMIMGQKSIFDNMTFLITNVKEYYLLINKNKFNKIYKEYIKPWIDNL